MDAQLFAKTYDIHPTLGCLAQCADTLPQPLTDWLEVARHLPELLEAGVARSEIGKLKAPKETAELLPEEERLHSRTTFHLLSAFVWGEKPPAARIPSWLASAAVNSAERLGMRPILSYAPFILWNWELIDPHGPMEPANIELQQYFLRTKHARWFNAIHVAIEAAGARVPFLMVQLHHARIADNVERMVGLFRECAQILEKVNAYLRRMPEQCERGSYFDLVRPYIQGFHDHTVIYSGFYEDQPQNFWGESGSQSGLIPDLDCGFGIPHRADGRFAEYLNEMPDYMPRGHRRYLQDLSKLTQQGEESLLLYALGRRGTYPELCEEWHRCVMLMVEFSDIHFGHGKGYIADQMPRASEYNRSDIGTGGMPFLPYLWEHREDRFHFAERLLRAA